MTESFSSLVGALFQTSGGKMSERTDNASDSKILTVCILTIVFVIISHYIFNVKIFQRSSQEPPILPPDYPFLGYLPTIFRHGFKFLDDLAKRNLHRFPHEIFTVPLLGTRMYVVTSPELISTIQGKRRYVSNDPLFMPWTLRWAGIKGDGAKRIPKDMNNRKVDSWASETHNNIVKVLGPGAALDGMRKTYIARSNVFVNNLADQVAHGQGDVDLWTFICQSVTIAGSTAVWGPSNPFEVHPDLWKVFWVYEEDLKYITNDVPLGWKGRKAREQLAKAFQHFHQNKEARDLAGPVAKARWAVCQKYGVTEGDTARLDVPAIVGQSANTIPATYGLLAFILHDGDLLGRVRQELDKLIIRGQGQEIMFDAYNIRDKCPLFRSTLYEVMRHISIGSTIRTIIEDYPLTVESPNAGQAHYVLRKNGTIFLAGSLVHNCSEFWPDAEQFKPERFLQYSSPEAQIPGLFRAFGGGIGLCGGRHLVVTEMLATIGTLLVRFDFDDVPKLALPDRRTIAFGQAMPKPYGNTIAKVRPRKGFEDCIWINSPSL